MSANILPQQGESMRVASKFEVNNMECLALELTNPEPVQTTRVHVGGEIDGALVEFEVTETKTEFGTTVMSQIIIVPDEDSDSVLMISFDDDYSLDNFEYDFGKQDEILAVLRELLQSDKVHGIEHEVVFRVWSVMSFLGQGLEAGDIADMSLSYDNSDQPEIFHTAAIIKQLVDQKVQLLQQNSVYEHTFDDGSILKIIHNELSGDLSNVGEGIPVMQIELADSSTGLLYYYIHHFNGKRELVVSDPSQPCPPDPLLQPEKDDKSALEVAFGDPVIFSADVEKIVDALKEAIYQEANANDWPR